MGTPITFSGFNQIDFTMILNAVMEQERAPLRGLETQKKTLEVQNNTFGTFLTKLGAVETVVKDLGKADSLAKLTASSSDDGVGVTTTSGTVEGTYEVVVSQLARAQVTASVSTYDSVDAVVGSSGTLSLLRTNQPPVEIELSGSMTLKQLADAINARSDSPVAASVVQAAPGSYQLVLTGRSTGTDNAFTMTSTVSGGEGLTFADTDNDGILAEAGEGNTQEARNATLSVNNLTITSATNTVSDVIPGVRLSLNREDVSTTALVTVKRDSTEVAKQVDKFVTAYNDIISFLKDQNTAASTGNPSIGRDPVLRSLRDALRTALLGDYPEGGAYSRLATVGIETDTLGKLKLDKTRFEAALSASPSDVQKLFAGSDGTGGAFGLLTSQVRNYTESGGLVASARTRLESQVSSLSKRLDTLESQLAVRRAALQQQYIAADMAMTQLKAQSSPLSAIGAQYRLF